VRLSFHPEAEQELLHSITYYENKSAGLGTEFLEEIGKTLDLIKSFPELGSPFTNADRRMLLNRFPFSIIYSIHRDHIIIYAFMHLHRKPGYWQIRR